ncbi:MAG: response regulator [Pirellulales bacterium]|nr:response regulator [Pirellulales bacterium]
MNDLARSDSHPLILLVEDDSSHAELVSRALQRKLPSCKVRRLSDGQSVLDYFFRQGDYADPATSPRPRVVLLDLRLPRIDGLDVLRRIKASESLRQTPVVVLTTSTAEEDVAQAYACHANSVVSKPADFTVFTELMQDLAAFWLQWNQDPWTGV